MGSLAGRTTKRPTLARAFDVGRITAGDPLPPAARPPVPEPNAEDKAAAAELYESAEYFAELRTVISAHEWEAARRHEVERESP